MVFGELRNGKEIIIWLGVGITYLYYFIALGVVLGGRLGGAVAVEGVRNSKKRKTYLREEIEDEMMMLLEDEYYNSNNNNTTAQWTYLLLSSPILCYSKHSSSTITIIYSVPVDG